MFKTINVEAVSFGPEGSDGSQFPISVSEPVQVDQMASEHESAVFKIKVTSNPDWDGWRSLQALRVAVRLVLSDGRICVFPKCLHNVDPPTATFTAQDIHAEADGKEVVYWALVDNERVVGNKKIEFPKA